MRLFYIPLLSFIKSRLKGPKKLSSLTSYLVTEREKSRDYCSFIRNFKLSSLNKSLFLPKISSFFGFKINDLSSISSVSIIVEFLLTLVFLHLAASYVITMLFLRSICVIAP